MARSRVLRVILVSSTIAALWALGAGAAHAVVGGRPPDGPAYHPERVLVKFMPGASRQQAEEAASALGLAELHYVSNIAVHVMRVAPGNSVEDTLAMLTQNPAVLYAEPDYYRYPADVFPNDTYYSYEWGLHNTGQTGGTSDADIDAPQAWSTISSSCDVIVAVIDTGVDYTHEDLACNMWVNTGEIPNDGIDNEGNGFVDDYYGYDFGANDGDPIPNPVSDDSNPWHGTHVAGTIGACTNNHLGVAGVTHCVRIMALKVVDNEDRFSSSAIIRAMDYAATMGAHVMNASYLGGDASQAEYDGLEAARQADVLFVAAAGNEGENNDEHPIYPASYDLPNIIAVASTDHNDQMASTSCYGASSVDLAAPGVSILSTYPGDLYATASGTSMATPHVVGAAALVWATDLSQTYGDVKDRILSTVDPLPSLQGFVLTGGRLNLSQAVGSPIAPCDSTSYTTPASSYQIADGETKTDMCGSVQYYRVTTAQTATITWTLTPDGVDSDLYTHDISGSVPTTTDYSCRPHYSGETQETCVTVDAPPGTYYAMVRQFAIGGSYAISVDVEGAPVPCDSTSYTTPASSYQMADGETKTDMCGLVQYYRVTTAQTATITWTLTPSFGDFDLHTKDTAGSVPTETDYSCRPWYGGDSSEVCTTVDAPPGTYYAMVHLWSGDGSYSISVDADDSNIQFADVPPDYWAYDEIIGCATADISYGYPDGYYRPELEITRAQMATFISRAHAGGESNVPPDGTYPIPSLVDVPSDHWAYRYVEYASAARIVQGYGGGYYLPDLLVDRGQMSVFIARSKGWVDLDDEMTSAPELFPDVPAGFWAGTAIQACRDEGVVVGYFNGLYYPDGIVTRAQMAMFIARAFHLIP